MYGRCSNSTGYSYNDYAIRSEYWPRLFRLSNPDRRFEALAAAGMPSEVVPQEKLFTASVPIRADLTWTDGSPFTAEDVAFTVNTALLFRLGFDWHAYYDPDWLDHAEAVEPHTVKFYFKRAPNVAVWQYGALQGPVVQKKYWETRIAEASVLLPPVTSPVQIDLLKARVAELQQRVDALLSAAVTATGEDTHQIQIELLHRQGDLGEAMSDLSKAEASLDNAMQAGRTALYKLDSKAEPTLGTWMPARLKNGTWVNKINPSLPFGKPHFDRSTYTMYTSEAAAFTALQKGEVNSILEPGGISPDQASKSASVGLVSNPSSTAYFAVINPSSKAFSDYILRKALFCTLDRDSLAQTIDATSLEYAVQPGNQDWFNLQGLVICGDDNQPRRAQAIALLKSAGYSWVSEPSGEQAGIEMMRPHGSTFPPMLLLAPPHDVDPRASAAATTIEEAASYLGLPLHAEYVSPDQLRYAVFQDGSYDLAIVGWHLSAYPGYLCDWFGEGNPFRYEAGPITSACQALDSTNDFRTAQGLVSAIQVSLAADPWFIPLFAGSTYDVYRGIGYPFDHVLDGLSGVYGAPSLAVPSAP